MKIEEVGRGEMEGGKRSRGVRVRAEGSGIAVAAVGPDVGTGLRYLRSERSLWLRDAFGSPCPLSVPVLSGRGNDEVGVDATEDSSRREADETKLIAMLGRNPITATPDD